MKVQIKHWHTLDKDAPPEIETNIGGDALFILSEKYDVAIINRETNEIPYLVLDIKYGRFRQR